MFEETVKGNADELLAHFIAKEPRGEFVIILGPTEITNSKKKREEEEN